MGPTLVALIELAFGEVESVTFVFSGLLQFFQTFSNFLKFQSHSGDLGAIRRHHEILCNDPAGSFGSLEHFFDG